MKRVYLIVTIAILFAANLHAGTPSPKNTRCDLISQLQDTVRDTKMQFWT